MGLEREAESETWSGTTLESGGVLLFSSFFFFPLAVKRQLVKCPLEKTLPLGKLQAQLIQYSCFTDRKIEAPRKQEKM